MIEFYLEINPYNEKLLCSQVRPEKDSLRFRMALADFPPVRELGLIIQSKWESNRLFFRIPTFVLADQRSAHIFTWEMTNILIRIGLDYLYYVRRVQNLDDEPVKHLVLSRFSGWSKGRHVLQEKLDTLGFPSDKIPEEFICPLSANIMHLPVRFQKGGKETIFDEQSFQIDARIKAQSGRMPEDPFTRISVTVDPDDAQSHDLVPDEDLYHRIQLFCTRVFIVKELGFKPADCVDEILRLQDEFDLREHLVKTGRLSSVYGKKHNQCSLTIADKFPFCSVFALFRLPVEEYIADVVISAPSSEHLRSVAVFFAPLQDQGMQLVTGRHANQMIIGDVNSEVNAAILGKFLCG